MRKRRLLLFIVLSVTVVIAVLCIQGYWLYQAYRLTNDDFREKVQTSLRVVAIRIRNLNAITTNEVVHINEQHANYFIAHIDNYIDPKLLETFLMNEFQRNDVLANFEFGIYDCAENNIRYGGYVCVDEHCDTTNTVHYNFPKLNETNYYFAVYFPNRSNFLFNQMRHWIASTLALIVLMLLFVYAVYLLLRQKKLSAMQQDFVNNITHEFKTPVASIAIATEMLEQENPLRQPNKYKLYVSVLRRETERLKMHIDSILRSTMQRHQHVFQMQQVSLHNQIHELLPSWEMLLLSCNGKINLEFNAKMI